MERADQHDPQNLCVLATYISEQYANLLYRGFNFDFQESFTESHLLLPDDVYQLEENSNLHYKALDYYEDYEQEDAEVQSPIHLEFINDQSISDPPPSHNSRKIDSEFSDTNTLFGECSHLKSLIDRQNEEMFQLMNNEWYSREREEGEESFIFYTQKDSADEIVSPTNILWDTSNYGNASISCTPETTIKLLTDDNRASNLNCHEAIETMVNQICTSDQLGSSLRIDEFHRITDVPSRSSSAKKVLRIFGRRVSFVIRFFGMMMKFTSETISFILSGTMKICKNRRLKGTSLSYEEDFDKILKDLSAHRTAVLITILSLIHI